MWIFRSLFVTLYDTRSYIYQASFVVHLYAISFASMTNTPSSNLPFEDRLYSEGNPTFIEERW